MSNDSHCEGVILLMEITWAQVVNSALPLFGVVIGSVATYLTQRKILDKQVARDKELEKKQENIERLKIYGEILERAGGTEIGGYDAGRYNFDLGIYRREFRPLFFQKYYLLDQEIAELIRQMDSVILESSLNGLLENNANDYLLRSYSRIIERMENYLKEYRV